MHVLPPGTQLAQAMPEGSEHTLPMRDLEKYLSPAQAEAVALSTLDAVAGDTMFKTGADYLKDNRHWRERLGGQVRLKKVRGQLMLVWVGRSDPAKFKHLPGTTYDMANPKVAGVTGCRSPER